jgi:hypothetical protein
VPRHDGGIAFLLWFVTHQIATAASTLADAIEGELQRRENIRENTRRNAEEALRRAYRDYNDLKFKEVDYNLGIGHGYRRAERLVKAKTWAEVEEIAAGDPEKFIDDLKYEEELIRREEWRKSSG